LRLDASVITNHSAERGFLELLGSLFAVAPSVPVPTLLGVKELGGALPHELRATGADGFAIATSLQMVGVDVEKPHTLLA
jgi:hypothetical protein